MLGVVPARLEIDAVQSGSSPAEKKAMCCMYGALLHTGMQGQLLCGGLRKPTNKKQE